MAKRDERKEGFFRLLVLLITGIILYLWGHLIIVLVIINWLIMIFSKKRNKSIAEFCETWSTQTYCFYKYITGITNKRPFPFDKLVDNISEFEK